MDKTIHVALKMLNIYKSTIDLAIVELGMIHEHADMGITFYENLIKDLKEEIMEIEYDRASLIKNDDITRIVCCSIKFADILYDYIIADLIYNMYPDCLAGSEYTKSREEREIDAYKRISKAIVKIKRMYFSERDKMK